MVRLPTPGGDDNKWGDILNEFLAQAHNADGSIKAEAIANKANVTDLNSHTANKNLHGAERTINPAVRRFRAEAERARSGGPSTMTVWLGDSLTEAYNPSKRGYIWPLILSRRLNGARPMRTEYIPASTSTFCLLTPASAWPGSQSPWNYSNANGAIEYGLDMHGARINAGGFVELPYFGDVINFVYVRTPEAPAGGCPITIDGVSAGTLNANGSLLTSQAIAIGTIGDYGAHTLRISVPSGTLTIEGAVVFDGPAWGFGLAFGAIGVSVAGHAGFSTTHFTDTNATNWAPGVAARAPCLVGIALGANDFGHLNLTAEQYRDGLITIMNRIDTAVDAVGGTRPGYLLIEMVGVPSSYVSAAWEACDSVDTDRCAVLDLQTRINTTNWGVLDSSGHPGDAGQLWIADIIANAIDPSASRPPSTPLEGIIIEAITPATTRSSWSEAAPPVGLTVVPDTVVPTTYDASPTGTTIGERRHRVWLDPGTYQARVTLSRGSDLGQCQILVGHTSLGTADCYQASADVTIFTMGSNVTIDSPGWYPISIRKLSTKNSSSSDYTVRFHRLHLRKV